MWPSKRKKKKTKKPFSILPGPLASLISEWGIVWPVEIIIGRVPFTPLADGACTTYFEEQRHVIHLSPAPVQHPERVLRHELGHAVDAERRFRDLHGHPRIAALSLRAEYGIYGYENSPCEVFARAHEDLRPDLTLIRTETK